MICDSTATDDDATEDEEEKEIDGVRCQSHEEEEESIAKRYGNYRKNYHNHGETDGIESVCLDCKDEDTTLKEWCKGQICLAPYSGDNEYYEAVISSLHKASSGKRMAVVTFIGYESEGSETVSETDLKTIKEQPGHKTSKGDTSSKKKKKGKLDISVQCSKKLPSGRRSINKQSRSVLLQDFDDVHSEKINTLVNPVKTDFDNGSKKQTEKRDYDDEMLADGFDDQDMERPFFTVPAPHPTVPLLLSEPGIEPVTQIPATINRYLRDYQRQGVRFLFRHFSENTGAILGDDMGLGKTVQVIAFVAAILGKTGTKADVFSKFVNGRTKGKQKNVSGFERGTFLIVSPGSVMYNWKEELETWGHFNTGLFHGNTKEDALQRAQRGRLDVVLTTYETMRNHLDDLNKIKWLAVILDEVHRLKDPKAQITKAAKALKVKRRYGLTGTPLQNRMREFWCVLDWANPGSLGKAKQFELEYDVPIREGQTYNATKRELALGRKKSKKLQDKIGKVFLRRTKDLIADQLPRKDELVVFCPLTPFQEDVYQTLLQNPDVELIRKKNFPCDCGSGMDRGKCCYMLSSEGENIKTTTMRFFQLLLKVANHAALLAPTVRQTLDQQEKAKELCLRVFARYPEFSGCTELSSFELMSDPKYCGKMKVLDKLLGIFRTEHSKVLLFSRSTQLLDILEEFVISKGMVYSRLDGSTKAADRTRLVREFNLDPSISLCLVSTKAGGLGLNFTGANVVIIFDPNWNPSSDLQAQDRAYRIGQRRDVRVYRLISSGTIEEMIYLRQVYKQQLANIAIKGTNERRYFTGVEGDKDRHGELFGLENLFSYRAEGASLSKDIVKRTEKLEAGFKVTKYEIVPEEKSEEALEDEMPDKPANPDEDEDPYNLEEFASQLIEDEHLGDPTSSDPSENVSVSKEQEADLNNDAVFKSNIKGVTHYEKLHSLQSEEPYLSDFEDLMRADITGPKTRDKSAISTMGSAAINRMSTEDFSSCEEDGNESEDLLSSFTRIKNKAGNLDHCSRTATESCEVIPPTASLKCGLDLNTANDVYSPEGEELSRSSEEQMESLSDEDSDEGLFTRSKEKRGKPKMVCARPSNRLREGRKRFRRFPGKKTPIDDVNSKEIDVKRSRKEESVEQILESCGVRYTHANKNIVGPSEAENHMTKQALQDVFELRQFSQQPANCFPALETSDESDDLGESPRKEKQDVQKPSEKPEAGTSSSYSPPSNRSLIIDHGAKVERIGNNTVFVGSTPRGIRRQHFREMSDKFGFSSQADFAKAVVRSNDKERWEMLKCYYVTSNPVLSGLSNFTACEVKSEERKESESLKRAQRSLKRTQENRSHEMSKNAKRKPQNSRAKKGILGKNMVREKTRDRLENHEQEILDSPPRKTVKSSTVSEVSHAVKLKKSAGLIDSRDIFKGPAHIGEQSVNSTSAGNYGSKLEEHGFNQTNQSPQEHRKYNSEESQSNADTEAKNQESSFASSSCASVSILDVFLSNGSDVGERKHTSANKRVCQVKSCSDKKQDGYCDKRNDKEAFKLKKKPTSILDDFI